MRRYSRAQAIAESILFLPLGLLTLWAIMWAAQYGLQAERVQSALRYSGLVANDTDPFEQYSMYVMYNSLGVGNSPTPLPSGTCNPPSTDALTNSNSYPGPTMAPYWLSSPAPPTTQCANGGNTAEGSYQTVAGVTLTNPSLVLSNIPQITTNVRVPMFLRPLFGGATKLPAAAALNFMKPADLGTTLNCFAGLQSSIAASVAPTPQTTSPATTPIPFPEPIPSPTYIPISSNC